MPNGLPEVSATGEYGEIQPYISQDYARQIALLGYRGRLNYLEPREINLKSYEINTPNLPSFPKYQLPKRNFLQKIQTGLGSSISGIRNQLSQLNIQAQQNEQRRQQREAFQEQRRVEAAERDRELTRDFQQQIQAPTFQKVKAGALGVKEDIVRFEQEKVVPYTSKIMSQEQLNRFEEASKEASIRQMSPLGIGGGLFVPSPIVETLKETPVVKEKAELEAGFSRQYIEEPIFHPIKSAVLFTAFAALPAGTSAAAKPVRQLAGKVSWLKPALNIGGTGAAIGLTGLYATSVALEAKEAAATEGAGGVGRVLGRTGSELTFMGLGSATGTKVIPKIKNIFTRKTLVPREDIVPFEVIQGETILPEAPPSQHLDLFYKKTYVLPKEQGKLGVWHATGEGSFGRTTTIGLGNRPLEAAGLWVTPSGAGVSEHFLRVQPRATAYGLNLFPSVSEPAILRIYPSGVEPVPASVSRAGYGKTSTNAVKRFFLTLAEKGKVYLPLTKAEAEGILTPNTKLTLIGDKYYSNIKGTNVPIFQYNVVDDIVAAAGKTTTPKTITLGQLASMYGVPESQGMITGGTLGLSMFGRSITSETSRTTSPAPTKISFTTPATTAASKPSTTSLFTSSKLPPSKPSRVPSYTPSLVPPSPPTYTPPSPPTYTPPTPPTYFPPSRPPTYTPPKQPPYYPPRVPPSRAPPYTPPVTPPVTPPSSYFIRKRSKKIKGTPLFQTYVKRKGKWLTIGKPTTKGRALKRGAGYAKETLGASFFIRRTKGTTRAKDIYFRPSPRIFRKPIRKGLEIKGSPVWIQKAGTRRESSTIRTARLTSWGERAEIKASKKKKNLIW